MRPLVGIVSNFEVEKKGYFCLENYIRAIEQSGALPIILPYVSEGDVDQLLDTLSGIVLSGGGDFPTEFYGADPHPSVQRMIPERDRFEFALARAAFERPVPVLGICRGMQILNVIAGGTIYPHTQDALPGVGDHRDGTPLEQVVHGISIEPNTYLSRLVESQNLSFRVNSSHHQAIARLAPGFIVSARADDGIVEAIEAPDRPFVIGVQWHPEAMFESEPACRSLIQNFAKACGVK
ncbi:MAG: gamma-glutamyl-gamma-aminobutyrate hydrolase family protein [Mesorhizobium sp.]|uniref:gamma-glutamyl-gamma-aminobutyrate hydrolase family protein n=2 Tax=Mesorhizobium TaxID=68287 RepID=UPI000FE2B170|nr:MULTISPECIES: gamma-glutamyl-gamma-aminobutyrate hydrolase family protein [unclassified Mesorhizobium]RWI34126.1 MAG: gamma-glutamyl-gamma-aminobutyrate hydrolase family protein [Mesorhizobium sp.]RWI63189.1 MAG: gamma-glutamyl-gamma-aminobutyrate hydrolase family protein [Mesorhizobium sp.]RWI82496.1 MAG: gamma-glutamyl-gamma-aminobutyrate hydrolase family protein [Mesorhizobium sp.]RWJ43928.1 MAG: gamma-glutamyl-gamma-aminobutyrate hydrolase family protein [Mesorhizobium sp.]RWJ57435.1 MA